jgi:hypothetical protein
MEQPAEFNSYVFEFLDTLPAALCAVGRLVPKVSAEPPSGIP